MKEYSDSNASKNSPKVSGDSQGDVYKGKETFTDVGELDRIPCPSEASDSYGNIKQ